MFDVFIKRYVGYTIKRAIEVLYGIERSLNPFEFVNLLYVHQTFLTRIQTMLV
jgi:hypothetical protein